MGIVRVWLYVFSTLRFLLGGPVNILWVTFQPGLSVDISCWVKAHHDPKGVHDTFGGVLSLSPSPSLAISESSDMFRSWRLLPTKIWLQQKRPGFSAHFPLALQRVRSIKNNLNNLTVVNGRGGQPFHHELTSWWCLRQFQPCSPQSSRRPSSQNIVLSAKMVPQILMINDDYIIKFPIFVRGFQFSYSHGHFLGILYTPYFFTHTMTYRYDPIWR
jgi:hypothetical protein